MLQWPVIALSAARSRPFKDIFDPDVKLNLDVDNECYLVNPLVCYYIHCFITRTESMNSGCLLPAPTDLKEGDPYGLGAIFSTTMPDPRDADSDEPVEMLSWEFLAFISVLIAMAPWYAWLPCPGSQAKKLPLGPMELAEGWYAKKLKFYSQFKRVKVAEVVKKWMHDFYAARHDAFLEVAAILFSIYMF